MGNTFIKIKDKGFLIQDGMLEIWLRLLALHLKPPAHSDDFTTKIRDHWLMVSSGIFSGWLPDWIPKELNETFSREGLPIIKEVTHSLINVLETMPSYLSKDSLNLLGINNGLFTKDIETRRFLEIGQAFLDLIDGKNIKPDFIPGSNFDPS